MKIDSAGLQMIAEEEGCRLHPYDDHDGQKLTYSSASGRYERTDGSPPKGFATIGVGHLIRPGEVFGEISQGRALEILRHDVADVEAALNRQVPETLEGWNQNRFNALCDFGINCGAMAATKYHLIGPILAQDWPAVEAPMKAINKSKGAVLPVLVRRRAREWVLFCKPVESVPSAIDAASELGKVSATIRDNLPDPLKVTLPDDDPPPTERNS